MTSWILRAIMVGSALVPTILVANAQADNATHSMALRIDGIEEGKPIPAEFAYCKPDGKGQTEPGGNLSPGVHWTGVPEGTKSLALIVVDPDVPAKFDDANKPGKTIAEDFPRQNFYHWVLINIPATLTGLMKGQDSKGVIEGGKPTGQTEYGINGINGYGFGGYDGPCPPWNDARLHHYQFRLVALDIPAIKVAEPAKGPDVEATIQGHVLAEAHVTGTYSNYSKGSSK